MVIDSPLPKNLGVEGKLDLELKHVEVEGYVSFKWIFYDIAFDWEPHLYVKARNSSASSD